MIRIAWSPYLRASEFVTGWQLIPLEGSDASVCWKKTGGYPGGSPQALFAMQTKPDPGTTDVFPGASKSGSLGRSIRRPRPRWRRCASGR